MKKTKKRRKLLNYKLQKAKYMESEGEDCKNQSDDKIDLMFQKLKEFHK